MRLDHLLSKEMSRGFIYCLVFKSRKLEENKIFPVAMRLGDTPVPIPNTMVKTQAADGTMLETIWESRWLPDLQKTKTTPESVLYRTDMFQWA